jgi:hypothetical protein
MFFSSNSALLNFVCLLRVMWHHSTDGRETSIAMILLLTVRS